MSSDGRIARRPMEMFYLKESHQTYELNKTDGDEVAKVQNIYTTLDNK